MSCVHQNEFERIRLEREELLKMMTSLASSATAQWKAQKGGLHGIPRLDAKQIQSAVPMVRDAYALLLISRAEAFMRDYLTSINVSLPPEPKLGSLIDQRRTEFNAAKPRIPIKKIEADAVHELRVQRNNYAHGYASAVFYSIERILKTLNDFFARIPG